jgi:hypothetical protein
MGAAKRRRQAGNYPVGGKSADLGDPLKHAVIYPDDIKLDIARIVRSIDWVGAAGGTCFFRMASGHVVLGYLAIPSAMALGGMVARIGPDPERDVVAFCGEGNLGRKDAGGMLAHYWLLVGGDLVDFSVGDWPLVCSEWEVTRTGRALPSPHWTIDLPKYHWAPRSAFDWDAAVDGFTPELGRVWYTGFAGDPPPWNAMLEDIAPLLRQIRHHVREQVEKLALKERVWAAQNGHTAIRLSRLAEIAADPGGVVIFPALLEKLIVLRGKPEITRETARELIAKAGLLLSDVGVTT